MADCPSLTTLFLPLEITIIIIIIIIANIIVTVIFIFIGVEQIFEILAEFTSISVLNRRQTLQLLLWFKIGMIWSPHSKIFNRCYTTGSHFNNFSISEIILIFALWFSSISNSNSKIVNRKVKPNDQKQRVASRNQEFWLTKILVFLQTLPAFDFRDEKYFLNSQSSVQTLNKQSSFSSSSFACSFQSSQDLSWQNVKKFWNRYFYSFTNCLFK